MTQTSKTLPRKNKTGPTEIHEYFTFRNSTETYLRKAPTQNVKTSTFSHLRRLAHMSNLLP
jgi:hypothetical protein